MKNLCDAIYHEAMFQLSPTPSRKVTADTLKFLRAPYQIDLTWYWIWQLWRG